jgi:hypothetical protein
VVVVRGNEMGTQREQRKRNVVVVQRSFGRRGGQGRDSGREHGFNKVSHASTDVIYKVQSPRNNAGEGRSMLSCPDKSIMRRGSSYGCRRGHL